MKLPSFACRPSRCQVGAGALAVGLKILCHPDRSVRFASPPQSCGGRTRSGGTCCCHLGRHGESAEDLSSLKGLWSTLHAHCSSQLKCELLFGSVCFYGEVNWGRKLTASDVTRAAKRRDDVRRGRKPPYWVGNTMQAAERRHGCGCCVRQRAGWNRPDQPPSMKRRWNLNQHCTSIAEHIY